MNRNTDTLFVRAGRPLRLHFDDTRITAAAIRQLSWRVEQGGGAIVESPSNADILVVDPAAPWVFHDYLRTKRIELRPSVVLAFWIPLCLTTRSLVWITHPCWQQVVIPSERPPHSEIPQGVTAYGSFLAGIAYSKMSQISNNKATPRSLVDLDRDSSVISYVDNSDLEVSRSLEHGASSDDEPLEVTHKFEHSVPHGTKPGFNSVSTTTSPRRPTEGQKDEAKVSDILPVGETSLPLDDIEMSASSSEPVEQPLKKSVPKSVALSKPVDLVKKQSSIVPDPSDAQRHNSSRHSSAQSELGISLSCADPSPISATVAVEHGISKPRSAPPTGEKGLSTAPQHVDTNPTSPVASETATVPKEAYVPPTLDWTPPPTSEKSNSTQLASSPKVPNVLTAEPLIGTTMALDTLEVRLPPAPSTSNRPSITGNEPAGEVDGPTTTQGQASIETTAPGKLAEPAMSIITSPIETSSLSTTNKPRVSTSTAPPNTPALIPKVLVLTSSTGLKRVLDLSSGARSSGPSPSNARKARARPKMRPIPQPEGNDSVASSSSPRTSLPQPKSKLKIQSSENGTSTKPRPSVVASKTGGTPFIRPRQSSTSTAVAPADSPASIESSPATNAAVSLPASATTTPATTVAADTPNPPGSSLSRPKKLIIRSPTTSPLTLSQPSASTSSTQTHPPSPGAADLFNTPPTPPTPTPEQLASLAAKRPAWTKEEDQYIIDYMNWVFAQDPLASTSEIMREIATNCPYRSVGNWQNRFTSKEDSIYMNEVPVLFERLTNRTSGASSSTNKNKTWEILSGTRTRSRRTVGYVDSSGDENGDSSDNGDGPPRKRSRRSRASMRRRSDRL